MVKFEMMNVRKQEFVIAWHRSFLI